MAVDLRVPMDPILAAFGVPTTVIRPAPDDAPIMTSGVWVSPDPMEMPLGTELQRKETRRVMAFARAEVPTVPRGTLVIAPEVLDGADLTWRVDGLERADSDHQRVVLVPVDLES